MKKHFFDSSSIRLVGFISGAIGIELILLALFWNQWPLSSNSAMIDTPPVFQTVLSGARGPTRTPPLELSLPIPSLSIQPTLTPSSTPEWMVYDGIDFRDAEVQVLFTLRCDQEVVNLEPFQVIPYSPELMESGEFSTNLDFSVAWEHLGYYGLWIHSGLAYNIGELAAYPLQIHLEQDPRGFFRTPDQVSQYLKDCMIGAEVRLHQDETVSVNTVSAAVRVPPSGVDEVSRHVMDLIPYLAETYPDSGFDQLTTPGLLFYFCGQQLTGESANPDYNQWTQARFIIGVMPSADD